MNDELLIEMVRKNPVLYDISHPKYMDVGAKLDIWNSIGRQMKADGLACKTRWNNIRDNYRKSLKKILTKRRQNSKIIKYYKYYEQLEFLKRYFNDREWKESGSDQPKEDDEIEELPIELPPVQTSCVTFLPPSSPTCPGFRRSPSPAPCLLPVTSIPSPTPATESLQSNAALKFMEYLIEKDKKTTSSTQHPIDSFLAGIAPVLKAFTPYYLNLAKSEIFAIVQKYEMKMITEQTLMATDDCEVLQNSVQKSERE